MTQLLQAFAAIVAGVVAAGAVLAFLLPLLIQGGHLTTGSAAGLWIVGGVVAGCVLFALLRPWRALGGPRQHDSR